MHKNISNLLAKIQQPLNHLSSNTNVDLQVNGTIVPLEVKDIDSLRDDLEKLIKSSTKGITGYYETGLALIQIRDGELYKPEYSNFYSYCKAKFELSETRIKQLIRAKNITDSVKDVVDENQIYLTEGICRELQKIKDVEMRSHCLQDVAKEGQVTAKKIHTKFRIKTLKELTERSQPDLPEVGSVVRVCTKHNPELYHFDQHWGIVLKQFEFSVSVKVLNYIIPTIHPQELNLIKDGDRTLATELIDRLDKIFLHPEATELISNICKFFVTSPYPFLERIDDRLLIKIEQELNIENLQNQKKATSRTTSRTTVKS